MSTVQVAGHLGEHVSGRPSSLVSMQMSLDRQCCVLVSIHAWHLPTTVSQTWCIGLQAKQSEFLVQVTSGLPALSVGQSSPAGTQIPKGEHCSPSAQPSPVLGSQATQRFSASRHSSRLSGQPTQWVSSVQLLSRQIPSVGAVPEQVVVVEEH